MTGSTPYGHEGLSDSPHSLRRSHCEHLITRTSTSGPSRQARPSSPAPRASAPSPRHPPSDSNAAAVPDVRSTRTTRPRTASSSDAAFPDGASRRPSSPGCRRANARTARRSDGSSVSSSSMHTSRRLVERNHPGGDEVQKGQGGKVTRRALPVKKLSFHGAKPPSHETVHLSVPFPFASVDEVGAVAVERVIVFARYRNRVVRRRRERHRELHRPASRPPHLLHHPRETER